MVGRAHYSKSRPNYASRSKPDKTVLGCDSYQFSAMLHPELAMELASDGRNGRWTELERAPGHSVVATVPDH